MKALQFSASAAKFLVLKPLGATVRCGDFLGFNTHAHILVTDGCFYSNKGMFLVAPPWK
jgi:hypothetical protein